MKLKDITINIKDNHLNHNYYLKFNDEKEWAKS
jgi:hypothetical protein